MLTTRPVLSVILGCTVGLVLTLGMAAAVGMDDSYPMDEKREDARKDGDMWIMWYGSRGVAPAPRTRTAPMRSGAMRSGRVESRRNRTVRGGGLHGGK